MNFSFLKTKDLKNGDLLALYSKGFYLMGNNEFDVRKEKVFNFLKHNSYWLQYVLLFIILLTAVFIRIQNLDLLKDVTTGQYISLELDSTLFLRYAEYIAEHGSLFTTDMMRSIP